MVYELNRESQWPEAMNIKLLFITSNSNGIESELKDKTPLLIETT